MSEKFHYDENNDILSIHKGFSSDEKFKGNVDIGDIIIDVSTQKRIRGIEIMNAIDFFKSFKIDSEMLKDIETAHLDAKVQPRGIILNLLIKTKNMEQCIPARIAVPLEAPLYN